MKNIPRAIFFDLDGTLIVNNRSGKELITDLYQAHLGGLGSEHLTSFMKAIFKHAGNILQRMFEPEKNAQSLVIESFCQAIVDVKGDPGAAEQMFEHFIELSTHGTKPSENAFEVLENLRRKGIATGIITNGIEKLQSAKIHFHGFVDKVDKIIISEKAGAHKPDSNIFEYALSQVNEIPANVWHVGDHPVNDISGAERAGITSIFYDPTGERLEKEFSNESIERPTYTVNDLEEVFLLAQNIFVRE